MRTLQEGVPVQSRIEIASTSLVLDLKPPEKNLCGLSHVVCDILLQQPKQTNTGGIKLNLAIFQKRQLIEHEQQYASLYLSQVQAFPFIFFKWAFPFFFFLQLF